VKQIERLTYYYKNINHIVLEEDRSIKALEFQLNELLDIIDDRFSTDGEKIKASQELSKISIIYKAIKDEMHKDQLIMARIDQMICCMIEKSEYCTKH